MFKSPGALNSDYSKVLHQIVLQSTSQVILSYFVDLKSISLSIIEYYQVERTYEER